MMAEQSSPIRNHPIVSREEWLAARIALLAKEKEFTRLRDALSRERRALPWVKVEKRYLFDVPGGTATLTDLFDDRSQLVVYHFMFSPEWSEGCKHCSFWADNFDGVPVHLTHRDVSFVAVSRAPLAKIEAFRTRMGWSFRWASSYRSDFNYDYHVSFTPEEIRSGAGFYNYASTKVPADREGVSVFYKDERGDLFHTYSAYARGIDMLNAAYHYLDLVPKGRDEERLTSPQAWVQYHDRYAE